MPEEPVWRHQRITKPMFDLPIGHWILKGRVVTCEGHTVIENGFVEVEDGKLSAVGRMEELGERGADAVDTGGTILPGLINSHAHLAWDGVHEIARQSTKDSPEISAYKSASNMLMNLQAGVTTVRDMGVKKASIAAKQAVQQGIFPGPRVLITGETMCQHGGHSYWCCREVTGVDDMRRAVREQIRNGADLVKLMACHDRLEFTDDELEAAIDEAHRNGIPTTSHATFNDAIYRMAMLGIDCIEHGGTMTDETVQLLLDKGIPIVATFTPYIVQDSPEIVREYDMAEWAIAERSQISSNDDRFAGVVKAAKAGVPVAFGTDAGCPAIPHDLVVPELKHRIEWGVVSDNYEAILSATRVAAVVNRLVDEVGTLTPGKSADVIVVDGNPLEELNALERVKAVFVGGRLILPRLGGQFSFR